jgi:DNA anti-recombination protein RmuC
MSERAYIQANGSNAQQPPFDTLAYTKILIEGGIPNEHAECMTEAQTMVAYSLKSHAATKADLEVLRITLQTYMYKLLMGHEAATNEKISSVESRLEKKISSVESRLEKKISSVESRLEKKISSVESRLEQKILSVESKLDKRITYVHAELDQKISSVESRLEQKILSVRSELKEDIASLRTEMYKLIKQSNNYTTMLVVSCTGVMLAAMMLLR